MIPLIWWYAVAQWLERRTLNQDNPNSNHVLACRTLEKVIRLINVVISHFSADAKCVMRCRKSSVEAVSVDWRDTSDAWRVFTRCQTQRPKYSFIKQSVPVTRVSGS